MSCRASSVCDVLLEIAVRGDPLSVLCGVGLAFPGGVFLTSHAVRAPQKGQALGWRSLLCVLRATSVSSLCATLVKVVAQVLQIQSPGAELLPVHSLEGHDAVQVATHLSARESSFSHLYVSPLTWFTSFSYSQNHSVPDVTLLH